MEAPMAGRTAWQWLLTGGLAAAAVGCGSTDKTPSWFNSARSNTSAPPVTPDPSFQAPTAVPVKAGDLPRAKAGSGIKPDTDVVFADTQVEAALAEGRAPADRDQLLDHARQRYQKALKADPKHKGAFLGLAKLYTRTED